ncbi:glycoside hydrolase [Chaetomidium leptoderma]|uniref:endo-1,3(4)-beta-glucanase n=1 Tax=Chaetomidium leptoderma TaxID=669021 RepID=A0AAN6ZWK1_9PEZI|nr:glycoside hydrolase [Chaetomidium leptoderma]
MVRPALGVASLALTARSARAASNYNMVDVFDATNFFNEFDFFTQPDPTHGFVQYVDAATASRDGLAGFTEGGVYLGVDYTNTTTTGRPSVRVTSKKAYTKGLFIADIAHMPAGSAGSSSCGLWPAFWMFGPNWPTSGEIDIIEGVNSQTANSVTLHTAAGCSVSNAGSLASTKLLSADCQGNEGCTQDTRASDNNYGPGFNAAGGGVYALEWTDAAIKVWFFPRGTDIATQLSSSSSSSSSSPSPETSTKTPDPTTFGTPLAVFAGSNCSIDQHFADHSLVFDTTFCGDWAGKTWASDAACAALADTCEAYVGANPAVFSEAYWLVNDVRVYQTAGSGSGSGASGGGGGGESKKRGRRGARRSGGGAVEGRRWQG